MTKTPPGAIVTDFQKAKAGDVFDNGDGARYRYVLLSSAPEWDANNETWWVCGNRWIASRQTFTQSGLALRVSGPRPISDDEANAYIARLAAADIAAGIE